VAGGSPLHSCVSHAPPPHPSKAARRRRIIELLGYYFLGFAIMSIILGIVWQRRMASHQARQQQQQQQQQGEPARPGAPSAAGASAPD